jgi:hypothetical protein
MNTPIASTLTLESVAEHFAHWRRNKDKGERIPEQLWHEAIGLLGTYRISEVTRALHLSGADLNKRRKLFEAQPPREGSERETAFVEVAPQVVHQALRTEATSGWMELARPDGLRLRIQSGEGADMMALIDRFMGV